MGAGFRRSSCGVTTGRDRCATSARLNNPAGLAIDSSGGLLIADTDNHRVRRIDVGTGIITTIAGTGTSGNSGDGGPASAAQLNAPLDLTFDGDGNLLILGNSQIRRIAVGTGIISTLSLPWTSALNLERMTFDSAGNLYLSREDKVWAIRGPIH